MKNERAKALLELMAKHADTVAKFLQGMNEAQFMEDEKTSMAVSFALLQMGECASKLLQIDPTLAEGSTDLPWHKIRGLRNRVVHGYEEINLKLLYKTATVSFPLLRTEITRLLEQ